MINKFKKYRGKGNMKTTLVIMAAGIGSRFGGGIKQLAPVGLNGEIIMDYTLLLEIPF
jgi:choline kinase